MANIVYPLYPLYHSTIVLSMLSVSNFGIWDPEVVMVNNSFHIDMRYGS